MIADPAGFLQARLTLLDRLVTVKARAISGLVFGRRPIQGTSAAVGMVLT